MAYRVEQNGNSRDIVFDGFEKGIADDPYEGIADMRNVNPISTPKEVSVNFSTAAATLPPVVNATSYTATVGSKTKANVLVVGGGGSGGRSGTSGYPGGGGGAGEYKTNSAYPITHATAYTVTVGAGGASVTTNATIGNAGQNSVFDTITALGGGPGGPGFNSGGGDGSIDGGSGGGGDRNGFSATGGATTSTTGGGHNGGGGSITGNGGGGGGGGAGSAGSNGGNGVGGNGGNGVANSISGASVTYAGGGGGGVNGAPNTQGTGGTGGGGAGGIGAGAGTAGTANTGGGGGGTWSGNSGAGGSGIVIIAVPTGIISSATGGTHTTSGGNDIWTFTSSGTWTPTFTNTSFVNEITVSSTSNWYNGMAVIINSISGSFGLSATAGSNTYYVLLVSSGVVTLYTDLACTTPVVFTATGGSGTLSTAQLANPYDSTQWNYGALSGGNLYTLWSNYFIDSTGQVWFIGDGYRGYALNTLQFCGNTNHSTLSTAGSLGIVAWKSYLFALIDSNIDYINIDTLQSTSGPNGSWVAGWKSINQAVVHKALSATDDAMYFCNGNYIGSILQNAGSTFNPSSSGTYTYNTQALALPINDFSTCLAQLGTTLLVGGANTFVYPWDRVSTSFDYPLIVAEPYVQRIVSTNSTAFIFAGKRGRIYMTNGANIELFKKFPDQISGTENPYYTWGDAMYFRNQLYFTLSCTTNAGTTISNFAGIWAVDVSSKTLRLENSLSFGDYAGTVPVLMPMSTTTNSAGNALYAGWVHSGSGGLDYSVSTPYSSYESYVDLDIVPVGTYYDPSTDRQIEYKLSKPLVAGEGVQVWWRGNLTDSFTQVTGVTSVTGALSGAGAVNFEKQQWIQLRIKIASTASTPSYTKLREARIR